MLVRSMFRGETDDPRRWRGWDRRPVARSDRDPDPARHLIGQAVESERRDHGYHALGYALGDLGERLVCVDVASRILVEAAADPDEFAIFKRPLKGRDRNTPLALFLRATNPLLLHTPSKLVLPNVLRGRPVTKQNR